jgi:hypothetical protein
MDHRLTTLERAFQLARSGQVSTITEIVKSLKRDGYSTDQIEGAVLKRQLTDLIKAARSGVSAQPVQKGEKRRTRAWREARRGWWR